MKPGNRRDTYEHPELCVPVRDHAGARWHNGDLDEPGQRATQHHVQEWHEGQRTILPGAVVQLYIQHVWHLSVLLYGSPVHGRNSDRRFIKLHVTEPLGGPVERFTSNVPKLSTGLLLFLFPATPHNPQLALS